MRVCIIVFLVLSATLSCLGQRQTLNSSSTQQPSLYLRNSGTSQPGQQYGYIFSNMQDGIIIQADTTGIDANTADGHIVIQRNGNVGIGTESPASLLDVKNSFYGGTGFVSVRPQNTQYEGGQLVLQGAGSYDLWNVDAYQDDFRIFNGATVSLQIDGISRNVGIGTTNPTNKLEVNGTIRAKEIIVESTGWSDFVFENDYDLPTLHEVSSFIEANGHLPDIPSAEEVAENGITLGEMNAKLLQKVEELTLYTLQQQELINTLLQKLEKLEAAQ